jgi:outer membrane protein TolC
VTLRPLAAGMDFSSDGDRHVTIVNISQLRTRVIDHNWDVLGKVLDYEIKRRAFEAERGLFDPALAFTYLHEDSRRPNTVEQRRQLEGVPELDERNDLYTGGVETLTPLGTRLGLTTSLSYFRNNLQFLNNPSLGATGEKDVVSFVGLTLTQPLLKDAGFKAATAALRVAASESDQAFQDFRRQLMVTLSSAELAYWNLAAAERQESYYLESMRLAEQMETDATTEVKAEKSPPLKLTTATAAVQERRARWLMGRQRVVDARAALAGFCGAELSSFRVISPVMSIPPKDMRPDSDVFGEALESNPDYLARLATKQTEEIRSQYAKNQLLPRFDLKAAYGLNGLGTGASSSFDDIEDASFPAWSVGIEFRYPLGNREARNRHAAALMRNQKAEADLAEVRLSLNNAIQSGRRKIQAALGALEAYHSAETGNREIVESHLVELKAGRGELFRVLDAEEKLNQAQVSAVAGAVTFQQASLEFELAAGTVLKNRGLEISKEQVFRRTAELVKCRRIDEASIRTLMGDLRSAVQAEAGK